MPVTMKEIAKLAGVSQPAVSAALNLSGTTKVSDKMRTRILDIAKKLNYVPNAAAQRLKGGATKTIGIYGVPYVSVLQQALMLEFSLELEKNGYNLLSCYGKSNEASARAIREMVSKGIDGIIITIPENPLANFKTAPVPYVYCPPWQMPGFDLVVNHSDGTFSAAMELIRSGCRKIGYVTIRRYSSGHNADTEKIDGLAKACKESALPFNEKSIITHHQFDYNAAKLAEYIQKQRFDGLLCANDYIAAKLETPLMKAGIAIPEDLKLCGYDGLSFCEFAPVPLATVIQPNSEFAATAIQILFERIAAKSLTPSPVGKLLRPTFHQSKSSGGAMDENETLVSHDTLSTIELNNKYNIGGKRK